MANFAKITLLDQRRKFMKTRSNLLCSKDLLKDQTSEYAEHHQHVINTFNDLIDVVDRAINDSEDIGKGR